MPCYTPLNQYKNIEDGRLVFRAPKNRPEGTWTKQMTVQCGQCIGCRIDRSIHWAARIVHEAQQHNEQNSFVTLTYDEENLPPNGSLNKHDIQKFMKRMRRKYGPMKYFQCGEYGNEGRPHHHVCLFGFKPDLKKSEPFSERQGIITYTSEELDERWGHGFTSWGELNYMSAAYVARYSLKKAYGKHAKEHYLRADEYGVAYWLEPEYITMSKGIGASWYDQYKSDLYPSDELPVPGRGVFKKICRYYEKKLEAENPDQYEKLKQARQIYYQTHKEEYTPEALFSKWKIKKAQLNQLKRTLL